MKTAILYQSYHHGNTKKLCDAVANVCGAALFDITAGEPDLSGYDRIGIASGIAYGKFYKEITAYVRESLPEGKETFLLYTCGKPGNSLTKDITAILEAKHCRILGTYGCKGFDTYGPLKLIGGLNKQSPTPEEIRGAVDFVRGL